MPAPDLRINGERDINEACLYLGYWGAVTGNGEFPLLFLRACVRFRDLPWPCLQVNQALLKAVKKWVGEGGKATLIGAPDADILLEAIEELKKEQQQEQRRFWPS